MEKSIIVNVTVNLNGDNQSTITKITNGEENCSNPNSENPYSKFGILHNNFLDSVKDFQGPIDELTALSKEFFKKYTNQEIPNILKNVEKGINISILEIFTVENGFSTNSCKYLNSLADIIFKPRTLRILNIINNLEQLELKALNDPQLTQKDQEVILTTLALSINSLDYWDNLPDEGDVKARAKKPFWKKFWRVVGIAAADIGAGALGSLINPAVGAATASAASKGAAG